MYFGFPDDEEAKQYRRLCQAVGLRVGQRPVAEVYRQAAERIADLRELHDLYRKRSVAERLLKHAELWIALCAGILVGIVVVLIDQVIRGSL